MSFDTFLWFKGFVVQGDALIEFFNRTVAFIGYFKNIITIVSRDIEEDILLSNIEMIPAEEKKQVEDKHA